MSQHARSGRVSGPGSSRQRRRGKMWAMRTIRFSRPVLSEQYVAIFSESNPPGSVFLHYWVGGKEIVALVRIARPG